MAEVDVFLNEEWPALGDAEALEKQLEQCTVSTFFIYLAIKTKFVVQTRIELLIAILT